ncbi:hypothetical protein ACF05L_18185 [Streptomyces bobili]|uniref:hypothetical protein n=1 Tax=Streptomyces bobili TaxID=67280 RepID=UPI0036F87EDD
MGECFFKLSVNTESFQSGGLASKRCSQGHAADRGGAQGGERVDQEVRVGGVWPAAPPVLQPLSGDLQCQFIQGSDTAVDHEFAVADVEVAQLEAPDRTGSCGVYCGEREDQTVGRLGDCVNGSVDVLDTPDSPSTRSSTPSKTC